MTLSDTTLAMLHATEEHFTAGRILQQQLQAAAC